MKFLILLLFILLSSVLIFAENGSLINETYKNNILRKSSEVIYNDQPLPEDPYEDFPKQMRTNASMKWQTDVNKTANLANRALQYVKQGNLVYLLIAIVVFIVLAKLVSIASEVIGKLLIAVLIILLIVALLKYLL